MGKTVYTPENESVAARYLRGITDEVRTCITGHVCSRPIPHGPAIERIIGPATQRIGKKFGNVEGFEHLLPDEDWDRFEFEDGSALLVQPPFRVIEKGSYNDGTWEWNDEPHTVISEASSPLCSCTLGTHDLIECESLRAGQCPHCGVSAAVRDAELEPGCDECVNLDGLLDARHKLIERTGGQTETTGEVQ